MADKMMRIAGRSPEGKAKALLVNEYGDLKVGQGQQILMDEFYSSQGREISSGETWTSETFLTEGMEKLTVATSINTSGEYHLYVEELVAGAFKKRKRITKPYTIDNEILETTVTTTQFRLVIENVSTVTLVVGLYAILSPNAKPKELTEKTLVEFAETGQRIEIPAGESWTSPRLKSDGLTTFTLSIFTFGNMPYSAHLIPYHRANMRPHLAIEMVGKNTTLGDTSVTRKMYSEYLALRITNHGDEPLELSPTLYATR